MTGVRGRSPFACTVHAGAILLLAAVFAKCASPSGAGIPTQNLAAWPPYTRGAPAGVDLQQAGPSAVRLVNSSGHSVWLWPGVPQVWHFGYPWVTGQPVDAVAELPAGGSLSFDVQLPAHDRCRVGVTLYDSRELATRHAAGGPDSDPWFVWTEIPCP